MKKQPLLVVVGPTASGKTALAVELAKKYNGEVISADSMQIYRGMDIATAKPTQDEMQGIRHHLLNFAEPDKPFSVAEYLKLARETIAQVARGGKMPVVAGGTGLYISSLLDHVQFSEATSKSPVRDRLQTLAEEIGPDAMHAKLAEVDPETARTLHPNNRFRIIRALEVFELTGKPFSEVKASSRVEESPYEVCMLGLGFHDRQKLYDRINRRVDVMLEKGLLEEAHAVYETGGLQTACQAIGYKEFLPYFNGGTPLDICVDKLKQETRRYAKRQLTWFRRDERIQWLYVDELDGMQNILERSEKIIANSKVMCYNEMNYI